MKTDLYPLPQQLAVYCQRILVEPSFQQHKVVRPFGALVEFVLLATRLLSHAGAQRSERGC